MRRTSPAGGEIALRAARGRLLRLQRRLPLAQLAVLAALFVYGASTIGGFSGLTEIDSMLVIAALVGLSATGQTLVVILGALDLSVSGYIVAGAIVVSQLCGTDGWPAPAAIALIVVMAATMGAATGWVCHFYRIQPLVITLGAGGLAAGSALAWTNGTVTGEAPSFLTTLTTPIAKTFGIGIPPIAAIWAAVAIVLAVVLHRTLPGRHLYATGANPRAAAFSLVRTRRVWVAVFATSAIVSALVGVLLAGFAGADQSIGDPYLWEGLTAVIIGGTTFAGARGDYTHTVIGALILIVLTTILVGNGFDSADQEMISGGLILLAVAGYGRDRRLRDRI